MKNEISLIYTTFPEEAILKSFVRNVLELKLIACANYWKIDSIYSYNDEIHEDKEWVCILKTHEMQLSQLYQVYTESHPYDVPCWLRLASECSDPYFNYIKNTLHASH